MTGSEAMELAHRKARYGHKDWLVWKDRAGNWQAALKSPETLKTALLAIGTQGRFYLVVASYSVSQMMVWQTGILAMRNCRYGI